MRQRKDCVGQLEFGAATGRWWSMRDHETVTIRRMVDVIS